MKIRPGYLLCFNSLAVTGFFLVCAGIQSAVAHDEPELNRSHQSATGPEKPTQTTAVSSCGTQKSDSRFTSYEPNTLTWPTKDDNDKKYLDVTVSIKYLLNKPPGLESKCRNDVWYWPEEWYASLTGRFSQYVKTRDSSPVIGKRFNPALVARFLQKGENYLDLSIGHESNGQNINTPGQFASEEAEQIEKNGNAGFARDKISRGWDYLGVTWKNAEYFKPDELPGLTTYYQFRYFLDNGPLQGRKEEWYEFENPGAEPEKRSEYDGLSALFVYDYYLKSDPGSSDSKSKKPVKFAAKYTTGYSKLFKHNTLRFELGFEMWSLPWLVFISQGYNSDLVDYYENTTTVGIGFEIGSSDLRETRNIPNADRANIL